MGLSEFVGPEAEYGPLDMHIQTSILKVDRAHRAIIIELLA